MKERPPSRRAPFGCRRTFLHLSALFQLSCAFLAAMVAWETEAEAAFTLAWKLTLPERKPAWEHTPRMLRDSAHPWAACKELILVGCEHNGAVLALEVATGRERWRFYTNGPVRLAPVVHRARIFVAGDDGFLYALDRSGRLLWKFSGGPSLRKVIAHSRLISAWPAACVAAAGGTVFFVAGHWPVDTVYVNALDAATGRVLWTNSSPHYRPSRLATVVDKTLFVYGYGGSGAYDVETGRKVPLKPPRPSRPEPAALPKDLVLDGKVLTAGRVDNRLIVITDRGTIHCFADRLPHEGLKRHSAPEVEAVEVQPHKAAVSAAELLSKAKVREGYAFVLGLCDGSLLEGLLRRSKLHVVAVDGDSTKVNWIRRRLDGAGLFNGHRLAVWEEDPEAFRIPPYAASLITSEKESFQLSEALRRSLHPYGGTLVVKRGGRWIVERRTGGVPGAGQWTCELADAANSLASAETVVRTPLGVLWYEGPAGDARFYYDGHVDHQSGHSVNPLPPGAEILQGRMILQGPGRLGAFDIYTGRLLWEAQIPEVYAWGGPGGGLGIHSKKHRKPWCYEEAMKYEVPATHHARATGLNFTTSREGIYVCAGTRLLQFSFESGALLKSLTMPIAEADAQELCWGCVRVCRQYLIATAFLPQDLVQAQCGHDGNGGEWAKDRMPMRYLLVVDRSTGSVLWKRRAQFGWLNRAIAVGRNTVFCVDTLAPNTLEKFLLAGRSVPSGRPALYACELSSGKERWRCDLEVLVTNLTYSEKYDVLIVPCRHLLVWRDGRWKPGHRKMGRNTPGRMRGLRGSDGKVLWQVEEAPYYEPHVLLDKIVIDRYCYAYDITTGRRNQRLNPLTGRNEVWHFRKSGCNHLVACPTLATWRTAVYDLAGHSGVLPLQGMNCGCTATMLPAGGVLNVPNFGTHHKRARMTALALIHQPENQCWTRYHTSRERSPAAPTALKRAGFNFGAPGDFIAGDSTLWLGIAERKRESLVLEVKELEWFRIESLVREDRIAAFGAEGLVRIRVPVLLAPNKRSAFNDKQLRRYDLELYFVERPGVREGDRVFSVQIEERPVIDRLDIVRAAGGPGKPLVRRLENLEVEGPLDISFSAACGRPLICGIKMAARGP